MTDDGGGGTKRGFLDPERLELVATIVMSIAVVLTAWSAFQAGKWSGVQSVTFAEAGAARTESVRLDTLSGQLTQLDIAVFSEWTAALSDDVTAGLVEAPRDSYEPDEGTRSGFLFERIRPEFQTVLNEWLTTEPIVDPDAPATPFAMEAYTMPGATEAEAQRARADQLAAEARTANQNGDNYVLTTVLFAAVLFFAGVSTKLASERNRAILLGVGVVILITAAVTVLTFPIEI
jgi:hypothetical protein